MIEVSNDLLALKKQKFNKLSIPTTEGFELIDSDDIVYLEAEINYTHLYLTDGTKLTSSKNLGFYEKELQAEPFVRIHNSTIVNLLKVKSYVRGDDGWLVLVNGKTLKVSKSKKDDLLLFFKARQSNNKPDR